MGFQPTPEQDAALVAYRTGEDMVLEAGAGTGKTSTLKLFCRTYPNRRGVYFAYNKSIADEARASFPETVQCATVHSLAYRAMARIWGGNVLRARLNAPRVPVRETARILRAEHLALGEGRKLADTQVARIAMETVSRFCYSADARPEKWHVPQVNGADTAEARAILTNAVVPLARKAWEDLSKPTGLLRFTHDCYLKVWAMGSPKLDGDFVLLDEAQDANPLVAQIVDGQTHMQRVAVGDACQSIYGWRGATDFLSKMDAKHHLYLTQSFRFGPAVAEEANKWLGLLGAKLRLVGTPTIGSRLGDLDLPDALLCRSNAAAVSALMRYNAAGIRAAVVGGGDDIRRLAEASNELRQTGRTWHPELCAFTSWGMVQEYVEQDAAGADLKVAVKLIDEYGADAIIDALTRSVPEKQAQVTLSTAHKSKGREWNRVKVADDFHPPMGDDEDKMPSREDMMLAYVTVTRAQHVLDRSGLAWVDQYLPGGARHALASGM
ncbi:MAG TPA: UvrD-helicase domain-containing protein, partial [Phytomonospora sp.]